MKRKIEVLKEQSGEETKITEPIKGEEITEPIEGEEITEPIEEEFETPEKMADHILTYDQEMLKEAALILCKKNKAFNTMIADIYDNKVAVEDVIEEPEEAAEVTEEIPEEITAEIPEKTEEVVTGAEMYESRNYDNEITIDDLPK